MNAANGDWGIDDELTAEVTALANALPGTVAVDARELRLRRRVKRNETVQLPSASVIKVAILVEFFHQVEEGLLALNETAVVRAEDKIEGSGVLTQLHDGLEVTLEDLAKLMITVSDNTASNMLLDRIGCKPVTTRMASLGLPGIVMGRKFYDFAARDQGFENWITAGDLSGLLQQIVEHRAASPESCEAMLKILAQQQFDGRIPRGLPPEVKVANKTGTISTACHDAGIIYAPSGPIILTVLTRDAPLDVAEGTIRRIASAVCDSWG